MNIKAGLILALLPVVAFQVTDAIGDQKLCDMVGEWVASVSKSGASIRDDDVRQRLRMDIENKLSPNNVQNFPQEAEKVNKIRAAAHVLLAERSEYYTIAFRFGADLAKGSLERALEAESVLLGSCGGVSTEHSTERSTERPTAVP